MANMEVRERVTRRWLDRWDNYLGSSLRSAVAGSRKVSVRDVEAADVVSGGANTSGVWAAAAAAAVAPAPSTPQPSGGLVAIPHEDRDREMAMTMSVVSSNGNSHGGNRRGRQVAATSAVGEREIPRRKRRGGGLLWRPEVAVAHVEEDFFEESSMTTCWVSTDPDDTLNGLSGCGGMGGGGAGGQQLKKLFALAAATAPAGASAKLSITATATSTPLLLPHSVSIEHQGEDMAVEESAFFSLAHHAGVVAGGGSMGSCDSHHRHATATNNNTSNNNNNVVGIDSLSDLALATIFSHLSSRDLGNASLVCKRWCDLADHTRTHLKLKISNLCREDADSMTTTSCSDSDVCPDPDDLLHRLLMRWPSLTHVEFNCVQASPMRTPGRYRSRLDFGNHTMDLLGMICGPRLQELVLIECLHIDASSIATCLGRCKNLKRLHIERLNLRGCFHGAGPYDCYCSIEDELIDAISDVNTLTHLWIECCTGQITSGQLSRLLSTPNLESLALDVKMWPWPEIPTLEQGGLGGGGSVGSDAPTPSVVFPPNNKMKELTWISLHPMYYPNFVTLTVSCTNLETLNLSCCILEAGIMGVVMRELSKGLLALRLMNCSFGGHSLLPFPEVLCPKLKELQIVGTSGAADIQCIAESCPALRRLVVEEPEIMMRQERHVSCGCGLGSAIYRLASRARRALRIRSRRLSNWHPGGVF